MLSETDPDGNVTSWADRKRCQEPLLPGAVLVQRLYSDN